MISSAMGLGIFLFMVGPSQILGFPDSFSLLIAGLVITANFLAPIALPALPEMIDAIKSTYPNSNFELAGNYASGLLNAGNNVGQILGPVYGASLYAALNFQLTQDIMALICIAFSLVYFFAADGKRTFQLTFKRQQEIRSPTPKIREEKQSM